MTNLPENGQLSEAAEAIQALKYDEESSLEGTVHIIRITMWKNIIEYYCVELMSWYIIERSNSYKEDGNAHFAKKNYDAAIVAYTEGLKFNCSDKELNANLFNNRAAAHFRLGIVYESSVKWQKVVISQHFQKGNACVQFEMKCYFLFTNKQYIIIN